jgi:hypothetical protein
MTDAANAAAERALADAKAKFRTTTWAFIDLARDIKGASPLVVKATEAQKASVLYVDALEIALAESERQREAAKRALEELMAINEFRAQIRKMMRDNKWVLDELTKYDSEHANAADDAGAGAEG